jgi:hypothetical protein
MIRHGATFPLTRRNIDPKDSHGKSAKGANGAAAYIGVSGFRHFMHEPAPEQRFPRFNGAYAGRSDHEVLHQLMGQLAERMSEKFDWPAHGVAGAEAWENPQIPSGYTYLLQLVAHDLVHSSVPMSIIEDAGSGMLNARRSGLRLETIYGGGPMVSPLAYALDDKQDDSRTKLRLGSIPEDPDIQPKGCPYRDIARVRPYGVNGDNRDPTRYDERDPARYNDPLPARTDPLLADPRNDAHVILSQMTALFHHLHNGILDLLPKRDARVSAESKSEAAHERYLCARGAATLIYRNVVRKEVMRLVLHPDVFAAYQKPDCRFLDDPRRSGPSGTAPGWSVPWEFSHGAFRFAHSMIRPHYRLNRYTRDATIREVIDTSSAKEPQNTPLRKEWLIQWSNFFCIDGSKPNLSRRIGPQYSAPLMKNPDIFPPLLEGSGANGGDPLSVGLAYRDLMSSGLAGLWSVGALIEEIRQRRPELIALSPLSDPKHRAAALRNWLGRHTRSKGLTNEADLASLADNPPLPFFIQFEAAMDPKTRGMRLGVLGSILVAEVVFGALQLDPLPFEVGAKSLKEALGRLSRSIYGDDKRLAGVPEIDTMSGLIKFTARCADLVDANPAFV